MTSISELEQDIAESRARLDRTIDRLQDRMTATGVVDELLGTARRTGYGSSLDRAAETLRAHPVPVLLVVAGLGWLAYSMTETGRRRDLRARARRDVDERVGERPPVRPVDRDAPETDERLRRERVERDAAQAARTAEAARRPDTGAGRATPATPTPTSAGTPTSASAGVAAKTPVSRAEEPPDRGGLAAGRRVGERVMGADGGLRSQDVAPGAVRRPENSGATRRPDEQKARETARLEPTHAAPEGEAMHRSPAPTPGRASPAAPGDLPPGARR